MQRTGRPRKFTDEERRARKAALNKAWRKKNIARVREANRIREAEYRARHPERIAKRQQASHFRNVYGITIEQRNALLAAQGGKCAICKVPEATHPKGWFVDHDHGTKKVRGILCGLCNSAIGFFKDDPVRCLAAAEYLNTHKS